MLPLEFKERMMRLLGDEAEDLFSHIENGQAVRAFRVNGAKISQSEFEDRGATIEKTKMETLENAYYTRESFPGSLPEHHSGAIYMQDPSAMATVAAVKLDVGMRVLDSCAAPGGKTGQLAAAVGDSGIVIANEYDAQRARILQSNVERLGLKNTVVLNLDTAVLRDTYPEFFDLVVCDAPCSGEGMFRKNERAIEEWSLQNVEMCAERQREILANVVKCVKKGGKLLYSTCTFSLEENEQNVAWLLDNYPEFELIDVSEELKNITADGICLENCKYDMTKTRRFYPHVSRGEGQFVTLLSKRDDGVSCAEANTNSLAKVEKTAKKHAKSGKKENKQLLNKQNIELIELGRAFLRDNLEGEVLGELRALGDKLWLCPDIDLTPYGVIAAGVCVGEAQRGRFVPHHQLFSACGCQFKRKLCLENGSEVAAKYLFGEELALEGTRALLDGGTDLCGGDCYVYADTPNGWAAVLIGGCACGGAKVSGAMAKEGAITSGVAKNHYPKGLRNKRIG